jgi:hypothetical protein
MTCTPTGEPASQVDGRAKVGGETTHAADYKVPNWGRTIKRTDKASVRAP